jgi:hypothetical protein
MALLLTALHTMSIKHKHLELRIYFSIVVSLIYVCSLLESTRGKSLGNQVVSRLMRLSTELRLF